MAIKPASWSGSRLIPGHFLIILALIALAISLVPAVPGSVESVSAASVTDLIITGAFDGPLTGGTPKVVELYVLNDIADLSLYGLGSANNGGGTDGQEFTFPADSATAGDFIYIAGTGHETDFTTFFGFAPNYTSSAVFINGDDALELFKSSAVVDTFGDINTDGSGEPWDYLDGWAYRNNATDPDGSTFVLANWTFSGINAMDGETSNSTAATPFPIGTYSTSSVDNPPQVSSTTPADSDTNVAVDANITINFNEPVDVTASGFTLDCGSGSLPFSSTPTLPATGTSSVELDPTSDLPNDATCAVTAVAAEITDSGANQLDGDGNGTGGDDYSFGFDIISAVDAPPQVSSTSPADSATGVSVGTNITINFNEAVDVTASGFTLDCGSGSLPFSSVPLLPATATSGVILSPTSDLPNSAACTVTAVAAEITDSGANQLDGDGNGTGGDDYSFSFTTAAPVATNVFINEVEADTSGSEVDEFIELYDGGVGNTPLDGLVVVLFNGSDDQSYEPQSGVFAAFDLDGYTTDANGYFVIGGTGVASADLVVNKTYWLQNGADAVALYEGNESDFPNDTPITTTNLFDAIVYETSDSDDAGLLPLLNAGQPQADESGRSMSWAHSNQRCPNGTGGNRNTDTYGQFAPTPDAENTCTLPADLSLTKTVNDSAVDELDTIIFTLTVTNNGPQDTTGVVVTDYLPDTTTQIESVSDDCGASLVGSTLTWTVGSLTNGNSATCNITATVRVGTDGTTFENLAEVTASDLPDEDSTPGNLSGTPAEDDEASAAVQVGPPAACLDPFTAIPTLQENGANFGNAGPFTVEGIVTGDFQPASPDGMEGFYIQAAAGDGNSATSDGIFVYDEIPIMMEIAVGDEVRITGTISEQYGQTQLTPTEVVLCDEGLSIVPTSVTLPVAAVADWENYEGMLITVSASSGNLTATETYSLAAYGEVSVSSGGRLFNPTNYVAPGAAANAEAANNNLRRLLIDDGRNGTVPDGTVPYIPTTASVFRQGFETPSITGVVGYGFSAYRLQPTVAPVWAPSNPRTVPPSVGGSLTVASFNVLNYFNGDGLGGGFPTARGAQTYAEYQLQHAKIVAAICDMNADVVGLMEIENDSGANSAISDLVTGLNGTSGCGPYAYVDTGMVGTDAIRVAFIYQTDTVSLVSAHQILDSSVDPTFIDTKNRPAVAQTFQQTSTGGMFTVAVNHLKSKGSDCDALGDPDTGDGQGNCNLTRTSAATALVNWLATDPTGSGDPDYLIIGDLNAYAMEDPITAIKAAGYTNLISVFDGPDAYSYTYFGESGYLDHALSNTALTPQVTGTADWHINTDEPSGRSYYNDDQPYLYEPNEFRASDHDPAIVGLNLVAPGYGSTPASGDTITINTLVGVSATASVEISETGAANLSVNSYAMTTNSEITVSGTSAPFTIADGGATETLTLTCNSASIGNFIDTLTVNHNALGSPATYTVQCNVLQSVTRNGDFPTDTSEWSFWGDITPAVNAGVLELTNTGAGGMYQDAGLTAPSGAPFEMLVDLGNSSAASKQIQLLLHNPDFSDTFFCQFTIPGGVGLQTYAMRGITSIAWDNIRTEIVPVTPDGLPAVLIDNVDVHYQPGLSVVGIECDPPDAPSTTNLTSNDDFALGESFWNFFDMANHNVSSEVLTFWDDDTTNGVWQDLFYSLPSAAPVTISVDIGNSSSQAKEVMIVLHDIDWSDLLLCYFNLPAHAPLGTYTLQAPTAEAWQNAMVAFWDLTGDNLQGLQLDNVNVQHQPGLSVSGVECGVPTAHANLNVARNGDFAQGEQYWNFYDVANHNVSGGILNTWDDDTTNGVWQDTFFGLPSAAPVNVSIDLGNTSSAAKEVMVVMHNQDWTDSLMCYFVLPANAALATYGLQAPTTQAWDKAFFALWDLTGDSMAGVQVDNVDIQYQPGLSVSGLTCLPPQAPTNTNLISNGDFAAGEALWEFLDVANHNVTGGVLNFWDSDTFNAVWQNTFYSVPASAPLQVTIDLGNTHTAFKEVGVVLHNSDLSETIQCAFDVWPNTTPDTFIVQGLTVSNWDTVTLALWDLDGNNQAAIQVDNVNVQYLPGLAVSGTVCTAPGFSPPAVSDLIRLEAESELITPNANWTPYSSVQASAGMYVYSSGSAQDTLHFAFNGTQLDVIYVQHPALGSFDVVVDGSVVAQISSNGAQAFDQRAQITGLSDGDHLAQIVPISGATIALDAFEVEALAIDQVDDPITEPTAEPTVEPTEEPTAEPIEEPTAEPTAIPIDPTAVPVDPTLLIVESDAANVEHAGVWSTYATAQASGGTYLYNSGNIQDTLSIAFTGTKLDVVYIQHPALGSFSVMVDGAVVATVNTSGEQAFGQRVSITGLPAGEHLAQIVTVAGQTFAIDAFAVEALVTVPPTATPVPTAEPTEEPTAEPVVGPTEEPTIVPTVEPTAEPTIEPTVEPTVEPTAKPLPTSTPVPPPPPVKPGQGN